MTDRYNRNPLIIPDRPHQDGPAGRKCPACASQNFDSHKAGDNLTFVCRDCKNQWGGGLPHQAQDPRVPRPPMNPRDRPVVDFFMNEDEKRIEELRRPVDLTQDFRKGAFVPGDEDGEW